MKTHTKYYRVVLSILLGLLGGFFVLSAVPVSSQTEPGVLQLITEMDISRQEQTAQQKGLTEVGRTMVLELKDGPEIRVIQPGGGEIDHQPLEIEVLFNPSQDGAAPNLTSIKVRYLKFFALDITDRVRPYISGNRIHVTKAEFPKGNHTVEIYLEDTEGKASSKVVEFKIL